MQQSQLIEGCKSNHKRAQIELYRRYHQGMYNVAMRLLMNAENAQDVVQESFLSAFKHISQFKAEVSFGAWLKKIVVNKCINELKKRKLEVVALDETKVDHMELEMDSDWEFGESFVLEDVKKEMNKLKDKYRFVVMLYLIEGYDHEEIAQILNIPVVTSRTHLMRGKAQLRQLLKHKGYGTES
ncbi:RNA polymerase sigma factor [Spongiimicrobium salis]|uniref:RNA polymerase sigma factor n=1 Tax=Spongiimicrobium salis TaxID=1667022 RepID=UPI00374D57BC